jgi:DNA-binding transcriptional LysR family regulator
MNLHLLRIFFAVAELKSFSRAAEALFISQPAVSKAVRGLEQQLGLPLIERGSGGAKGVKGLRLSESGQALFNHARGIFALERAAIEDVRARIDLERGKLIIGASTTVAGYCLPSYVAGFLQKFPSTQLEIRVGNTTDISEALIDCDIDLALVEGAVDDTRIMSARWQDDELKIIAPPNSTLARKRKPNIENLNEEVWLMREHGSGTREVNERLMQAHGIQPKRTIEFGSNEGIARAVAAGMGIAMMPTLVVRELLMVGEVKAVRYPYSIPLLRPLFILKLSERPISPLAHAFFELLSISALFLPAISMNFCQSC